MERSIRIIRIKKNLDLSLGTKKKIESFSKIGLELDNALYHP